MSEQAKWQACTDTYNQDKATVFIAWFEETKNNLSRFFAAKGITDAVLLHADFARNGNNNPMVFIEHFPLEEEEQRKYLDLGLEAALVFSSLDEPIFSFFGGGKIIPLMQKMGMKEDEAIEHDMITASIKKAQEKIGKKAIVTSSARSQADWLLNAGISND